MALGHEYYGDVMVRVLESLPLVEDMGNLEVVLEMLLGAVLLLGG